MHSYTTDVEAIVCRSFLSPDPPPNPLTVVLVTGNLTAREKFDQSWVCNRCERLSRRDGCSGCPLSFIDPVEIDMAALRDRLYSEWAKAKATHTEIKRARKEALTHEERAEWRAEHHHAQKVLTEATRACFLAEFNPLKRARREASGKK